MRKIPNPHLYGFRAVYVFDISQTEGKDFPTLTEVQGDVSGYRERLVKFVKAQSIELRYSDQIAPAKGLSHGGKITLLSARARLRWKRLTDGRGFHVRIANAH